MTSLIFYNYKNGATNGATLDCYTPAGERYFRFHLAVLTALTPNCPDVYYEYPNNPKTFVDYLAENHLLPSLDADAIISAYGEWDAYANSSLANNTLPVNDFFTFLDIITKVTIHNFTITHSTVMAPEDIVMSDTY